MRIDFRPLASAAATAMAILFATVLPAQATVVFENLPGEVEVVDPTVSRGKGVADVPGDLDIVLYGVDLPLSLAMAADKVYGFTVDDDTEGWLWAYALAGPPVGGERPFSSGTGLCGEGGSRCAPWTVRHSDSATRIHHVPEPAMLATVGLALAWLAAFARQPRRGVGVEPGRVP